MSSTLERMLVGVLEGVRKRSNATFKRFHPINPDLGIFLDYNEVISFNHASVRRLRGMRNVAIDQALGNTDPARSLLGHAQKISGSLEHVVLATVRSATHRGIHAARIAEVDLLTGYGALAHLEFTHAEQLQLDQGQLHLPEIPVISVALQAIGRSMARVDLAPAADKKNKILASDRNGNIINRGMTDTLLAGIGGLLLGPSEESSREI